MAHCIDTLAKHNASNKSDWQITPGDVLVISRDCLAFRGKVPGSASYACWACDLTRASPVQP